MVAHRLWSPLLFLLLSLLPMTLPAQTEAEAGNPLPIGKQGRRMTVEIKSGTKVRYQTAQSEEVRTGVYQDFVDGTVVLDNGRVPAGEITLIRARGLGAGTAVAIVYMFFLGALMGLLGWLFLELGKSGGDLAFVLLLIFFVIPFLTGGAVLVFAAFVTFLVALIVGRKFDLRKKWEIRPRQGN